MTLITCPSAVVQPILDAWQISQDSGKNEGTGDTAQEKVLNTCFRRGWLDIHLPCLPSPMIDQRLLTFAVGFRSSTAPLPARLPSCESISRFFLSSSILATELHDLGEAEDSLLPFLPQSRGRKGREEGSLAQYVSWNPSLCVAGLQAASDMPPPISGQGEGKASWGAEGFLKSQSVRSIPHTERHGQKYRF